MPTSIDETELARLEALAGKASNGPYNVDETARALWVSDGDERCWDIVNAKSLLHIVDLHYIAAACNAVPALVAEVRRLRRNYECSEKSLQRHEHMVAELMEKVEAWEWFEECFEVMQWLVLIGPNRADACEEAVISTLHAQKRAVHADRE